MEKKDYMFDDIFEREVKFDEEFKENNKDQNVSGDYRLSKGMYRTNEEKEKYAKDSLDRELS